MKIDKVQREMLRREFAKAWGGDTKMTDYCAKKASGFIDFGDVLVVMDKPHIQTDFWFGEHTYDYDEVCELCDAASRSERYFIDYNMKHNCDAARHLENMDGGWRELWVFPREYSCQGGDCRLGYVKWLGNDDRSEWEKRHSNPRKATAGELDGFRELCEGEVEKYRKRLGTYLKRYGLDKCHYGVFWADR